MKIYKFQPDVSIEAVEEFRKQLEEGKDIFTNAQVVVTNIPVLLTFEQALEGMELNLRYQK